jgi:hypothetical protein
MFWMLAAAFLRRNYPPGKPRQSQLLALVSMHKALGGGWDPEAIAALAE